MAAAVAPVFPLVVAKVVAHGNAGFIPSVVVGALAVAVVVCSAVISRGGGVV